MRKGVVISPSLTIYRPELVTLMSIMGRATGVILSIMVYVWVVVMKLKGLLLSNYIYYLIMYFIFKSEIGGILLSGVVLFVLLGFYYHLIYAIRNIIWFFYEEQLKMDLETIYKVGYIIIALSVGIAVINWLYLLL